MGERRDAELVKDSLKLDLVQLKVASVAPPAAVAATAFLLLLAVGASCVLVVCFRRRRSGHSRRQQAAGQRAMAFNGVAMQPALSDRHLLSRTMSFPKCSAPRTWTRTRGGLFRARGFGRVSADDTTPSALDEIIE